MCERIIKKAKENIVLSISVSLLLSVTIFLFGPLEILMSSSTEFWFSVNDVLPVILGSFFGCFLIILLLLEMISLIGGIIYKIVIAIFSGMGIGFYIQGNWTFVNYGKMDGTAIDWSSYKTWSWVNTGIWIAIILLSLVLLLAIKGTKKVFAFLFFGIVGVELLTLGTLCLTSQNNNASEAFYLSSEGQLELSKNKENIIVILSDGFDGSNFLEVLKEVPEWETEFEGFTFYEDTCGTSLYSEESAITLLTGNQFEVGPDFDENVDNAYANSKLYEELKKNNFSIELYLADDRMVSPQILDYLDNANAGMAELSGYKETFEKIYKMVAFRYTPHILKKHFWYSTMEFSELKTSSAFSWSNIELYNLIIRDGIKTIKTDENVYQFFWIQGPHNPVVMDRYCRPTDTSINIDDSRYQAAQFEQTIGVVRLYTELINAMKAADVYDNTTIIFTADHGWNVRPNPLLLIKPAEATGAMKISSVPVSMIEDYMPTLLYFVTGKKEYGKTIYELTEKEERSRLFYVYDINNDRTYNDRTTNYIEAGAFSKSFRLGEVLTPIRLGIYAKKGLSGSEDTHIWTNGNEVNFEFEFTEEYNNLLLEMNYWTAIDREEVRLFANGYLVADYFASGEEKKKIIIPKEYIQDAKLALRFELPDAISPLDRGTGTDSRDLALAFTSMKISSTDEAFDMVSQTEAYRYSLGTELSFTKENPTANANVIKGFSDNEENFTWSSGKEAKMMFKFYEDFDNLSLELGIERIFGKTQEVLIYANGSLILDTELSGGETRKIVIPKEYVQNGTLELEYRFPNADSPFNQGISPDARILAVAFETIKITSTLEDVITMQEEDYNYFLDTKLLFTKESSSANKFCIEGFSNSEQKYTWTNNTKAEMKFLIRDKFENLLVDLEYDRVYAMEQKVILFANDNEVLNYVATDAETKTFIIPGEYVKDGWLTLRFELPNAMSPLNRGEGEDARQLALAMKSITITSTEEKIN